MVNTGMDKELFKDHEDYWLVAQNIKDIYLSEGTLLTLLDFERVLDELDIYAFRNWSKGELVQGPVIGRYRVACTFMWPAKLMPDPRGAKRLLPFDCEINWKKTTIMIPIKIDTPSDYRAGTHKARLVPKKVWLVEIIMPKNLISDIRTGSIELEGEDIDLAELDDAYQKDLDQDQYRSDQSAQPTQAAPQPQAAAMPPALGV